MSRKFGLKLVIEKQSQKVVFAEVGKDVVDFLLSLFALPMGSVINLITKDSSIGSLGTMYSSWGKLNHTFLSSFAMTANRLIPAIASPSSTEKSSNFSRILSSASPATVTMNLYKCNYNDQCRSNDVTDGHNTACKSCYRLMNSPIGYKYIGHNITKEEVNNGYVTGGLTYAVMDDLSIEPLSTSLSSVSLLNKMGHSNLGQLDQKTVSLDVQTEGLELLKTSLWSKNVLTDVFLSKKNDGIQNQDK